MSILLLNEFFKWVNKIPQGFFTLYVAKKCHIDIYVLRIMISKTFKLLNFNLKHTFLPFSRGHLIHKFWLLHKIDYVTIGKFCQQKMTLLWHSKQEFRRLLAADNFLHCMKIYFVFKWIPSRLNKSYNNSWFHPWPKLKCGKPWQLTSGLIPLPSYFFWNNKIFTALITKIHGKIKYCRRILMRVISRNF